MRIFLLLCFLSISILSSAQTVINASDSVIFDLAKATITTSYIEFPISISSDNTDTINALDFQIKFNNSNLSFVTITSLTNFLQPPTYFMHPVDSTLRFTSYSLLTNGIPSDTSLVMVRCSLVNAQVSMSDFVFFKAFLNGFSCSYGVVNLITTDIADVGYENFLKVYPNPVKDILKINVKDKSTIQVLNYDGAVLYQSDEVLSEVLDVNSMNLTDGLYLVCVFNENYSSVKKVLVQRRLN